MRVRRPAPAPIPTPVFDDGRCSLSRFTDSRCAICAEICPTDALTAEADGLALNRDACTGCGACAAACPEQAIRLPGLLPLPPAAPDRTGAVTLICSRHPHAGRSAGPLCLRALGLEVLARLWLDGVRVIRLATGDCAECASGPGTGFEARLARLNGLLADRGLAPMRSQPATAADLGRGPWLGDAEDRPDPARRSLLRRLSLDVTVPETQPAQSALARLQKMGQGDSDARIAFQPLLSASDCTGCNACTRICPHAVLTLVNVGGPGAAYAVSGETCTGCGVCVDVCDSDAVVIVRDAPRVSDLPLLAYRCRACGVESHAPEQQEAVPELCGVCVRTRHSAKLFQVLE